MSAEVQPPAIRGVKVIAFDLRVEGETRTLMFIAAGLCGTCSLATVQAALSEMQRHGASHDAVGLDRVELWPGTWILLDRDSTSAAGFPVFAVLESDAIEVWLTGARYVESIRVVDAGAYQA